MFAVECWFSELFFEFSVRLLSSVFRSSECLSVVSQTSYCVKIGIQNLFTFFSSKILSLV